MTVTEPTPVQRHPVWRPLKAHAEKANTLRLAETQGDRDRWLERHRQDRCGAPRQLEKVVTTDVG